MSDYPTDEQLEKIEKWELRERQALAAKCAFKDGLLQAADLIRDGDYAWQSRKRIAVFADKFWKDELNGDGKKNIENPKG